MSLLSIWIFCLFILLINALLLKLSCFHNQDFREVRNNLSSSRNKCRKQTSSVSLSTHLYSVQFSPSVVSYSLRPHELQHAGPPCPSPTPGVYPNSCPSSWWCHPAISSSEVPFSSCPQCLPASGFFQWVKSSHEAKVLEFQFQHQSFQWTPRTGLL